MGESGSERIANNFLLKRVKGCGWKVESWLVLLISLPLSAMAVPVAIVSATKEQQRVSFTNRTFVVQGDAFVRDGRPVQVISGELHYFRIPQQYWRDRMLRTKAMGFNTIQTYVAWNFHEPTKGTINFSGDRDIEAFIDLARELDLMVLLRPGPYICAEWEFGGLPSWLLADESLRLRTYEPAYIGAVSRWWINLLSRMRKHLYHNGGPIIAVQIENEYGQYGNVETNVDDERYLRHLVHLARHNLGPHVVLYTTDFGNLANMRRGSLNGSEVLTVGDFGPSNNFSESLAAQVFTRCLLVSLGVEYLSLVVEYRSLESLVTASTPSYFPFASTFSLRTYM